MSRHKGGYRAARAAKKHISGKPYNLVTFLFARQCNITNHIMWTCNFWKCPYSGQEWSKSAFDKLLKKKCASEIDSKLFPVHNGGTSFLSSKNFLSGAAGKVRLKVNLISELEHFHNDQKLSFRENQIFIMISTFLLGETGLSTIISSLKKSYWFLTFSKCTDFLVAVYGNQNKMCDFSFKRSISLIFVKVIKEEIKLFFWKISRRSVDIQSL